MMNNPSYKTTVQNMRRRTTRLDREGDYWSQAEWDQLIRLFEEGMGITEIAIRLQRTEPAVFQQIEKLDLYRRRENPQRARAHRARRGCLCSACQAPEASCPLHTRLTAEREVG